MRTRLLRPLLIASLLGILAAGLIFGCTAGSGHGPKGADAAFEPFNLGKSAYKLGLKASQINATCASAKAAVWEAYQTEFIDAVNNLIPQETLQKLPEGMKSMFPLVDDGTIPSMTNEMATVFEELLDESKDPGKATLKAIIEGVQGPSLLRRDDWFALFGRFLQYPEIESFVGALANLIRQNDGVDESGKPNGEEDLISEALSYISTKLTEFPGHTPDTFLKSELAKALLDEVSLSPGVDFGAPAWSVRVDKNGNALVAIDFVTGKLFAPYQDLDGDGIADVNAGGQPVDASGQAIDISPFGTDGARDEYGRALSPSGLPLFVYYDAKRTALSLLLQLGGDLLEARADRDLYIVLSSVLGDLVPRDNGTPFDPLDDYWGYSPENPLTDLYYGGTELFRYPEADRLLRTFSKLVEDDPALAEQVILAISTILDAIRKGSFLKSAADWQYTLELAESFLPLLDNIFEKKPGTAISTARLLFEVSDEIGQSAKELPSEIALTMKYRTIVQTVPCEPSPLDLMKSFLVDYSKPRYDGGIDNRSVFEKNAELMVAVDGPKLPLVGKSIAELVIEVLATQNESLICNLSNTVVKWGGMPIVKPIASFLLSLLGYDGNAVLGSLDSLQGLAQSGALDGYLPLARVFVERGETKTLLGMYHVVVNDLVRDEDSNPATYSVIRRAEPLAIEVLSGKAPLAFFDLISLMLAIPAEGSTDSSLGLLADAIANLVDDDQIVYRRDHTIAPTLAHLLTEPLREITLGLEYAKAFERFDKLLGSFISLGLVTKTNDNGTPTWKADDFQELQNKSLVPLLGKTLVFSGELLDKTPAEVDDLVMDARARYEEFVGSKTFSASMKLAHLVVLSPGYDPLADAVVKLLRPNTDASQDVFGAGIRIVALLMEKKPDDGPWEKITPFLAKVINPSNGFIVHMIDGIEKMMQLDYTDTGLSIWKNLFYQGSGGTSKAPLSTFMDLLGDLGNINEDCQPKASSKASTTLDDVSETLQDVVDFLKYDTDLGLPKLYELIKNRN